MTDDLVDVSQTWLKRNAIGAFIVAPIVTFLTWELMDRTPPPYIRESGEIITGSPKDCGLSLDDTVPAEIISGTCIAAKWKITPIRNCPASEEFNVSRFIIDSKEGKHVLPSVSSEYGRRHSLGVGAITRYFPLSGLYPEGPARYSAPASFACNFMQYAWPIIVNDPEYIEFYIGPSPTQIQGR